ncbi:MAG: DUF4038 domain-containing protein [Acidobacteriota bacterium]
MKLLLALLCLATSGWAADVYRYGRFEASFTASKDYDDPLELNVVADFTGPGRAHVRIPAFWDGGRTWKVRFSPEKTGTWTYRVQASDAQETGLHGKTGRVQVKAYRGTNQLYVHGAPRVAPGKHYFLHADGKPWFWLACTGWNGAQQSTDEEWARYLADRHAKRYSAIQFVMAAPWRAGRKDENGRVAFTMTDRLRVDPEYFQRMDRKIDQMNDRELVGVAVMLWALTSKDNESPGAALSTPNAIRLARYMAARYGAHHMIWLLGGDGSYERGDGPERWKQIGRGTFPQDEFRRPVSLHPAGRRDPWPIFKDEPWLDFYNYQSGHGNDQAKWEWNATKGTASGWKLTPTKPVVDTEPNYEGLTSRDGKVFGADSVRRAVWYSLLAGPPAGVTYGAHGVWYWARTAALPLDHAHTGMAQPWFESIDYPGSKQMTIVRNVLEGLPWWKLEPNRFLLANEPDRVDWTAYPMPVSTSDGKFGLVYLPNNPSIELNLSDFGDARATWIDPRTGARTLAGRLKEAAKVPLKTPASGDWLLLLRKD